MQKLFLNPIKNFLFLGLQLDFNNPKYIRLLIKLVNKILVLRIDFFFYYFHFIINKAFPPIFNFLLFSIVIIPALVDNTIIPSLESNFQIFLIE